MQEHVQNAAALKMSVQMSTGCPCVGLQPVTLASGTEELSIYFSFNLLIPYLIFLLGNWDCWIIWTCESTFLSWKTIYFTGKKKSDPGLAFSPKRDPRSCNTLARSFLRCFDNCKFYETSIRNVSNKNLGFDLKWPVKENTGVWRLVQEEEIVLALIMQWSSNILDIDGINIIVCLYSC